MKPKICVSIAAEKPSSLPTMIRKAEEAEADLIEIRLDYLNIEARKYAGILKDLAGEATVPMIATNRRYGEGGRKPQDEDSRIQTLIWAAQAGFEYVDIELEAPGIESVIDSVRNCGSKLIISSHNFRDTPSVQKMKEIILSELRVGADICKIVTTAQSIKDNVKCLLLVNEMSKLTRIVAFAMGRLGLISRILSPIFGGYFTFASLTENMTTAPGQITIDELRMLYERLGVYK